MRGGGARGATRRINLVRYFERLTSRLVKHVRTCLVTRLDSE